DNCAVVSVTNNAPSQFQPGTNTVTWTVTDSHGLTNTCTQLVIVAANPTPQITCPANITTNAPAGYCYVSGLFLGNPTVNYSGSGTVTVSNNAPAQYPVGTNWVTWTASDGCSSSICSQRVIIINHFPPLLGGVQFATPAVAGATLSWEEAFTGDMTYNVY